MNPRGPLASLFWCCEFSMGGDSRAAWLPAWVWCRNALKQPVCLPQQPFPPPPPLPFSPILITSSFSDRSGHSWWLCLLWFKVDLKKHQGTVFRKPHCTNPWRYISEIELLDLQVQSREHLLTWGSKRQSRCVLLYQTKRKEIRIWFSQASPAIKGWK